MLLLPSTLTAMSEADDNSVAQVGREHVVQVDCILRERLGTRGYETDGARNIESDRRLIVLHWQGEALGKAVVRQGDGASAARGRFETLRVAFGQADARRLLQDVRTNRKKAPKLVEMMCEMLLELNKVDTQQAIEAARERFVAADAAAEAEAE